MSPFLLILTAKESYYSTFWKMIRLWSKVLVYGMGFRIDAKLEEELIAANLEINKYKEEAKRRTEENIEQQFLIAK